MGSQRAPDDPPVANKPPDVPIINPYPGRQSNGEQTSELMYPFDEKDYLSSINSMKQMHDQPLPFRLPFSGFAFNYIWVSHITPDTYNGFQ